MEDLFCVFTTARGLIFHISNYQDSNKKRSDAILFGTVFASPQEVIPGTDNTFSIVGVDPETGAVGVAVSTARLAVGNRVPFAKAGVGAIATQANTNVTLGYEGIRLLEQGSTVQEALEAILAADPGREERQITIIDIRNAKAAFTGSKTQEYKGHLFGENCVVAGNMLVGLETLEAMVEAFSTQVINQPENALGDKLMSALEAGQKAGGDKRGKLSAALLVATNSIHPYIDIRIDKSTDPVRELRVLYDEYKRSF